MNSEPVMVMNGTLGLAGDGPGEEGLAGAGRTDEQDAFGDAGTDLLEPGGILQELDHLADLLLHRS